MLEREERGVEGARERLSSGIGSVFVSVVVAIVGVLLFLKRLLMLLLCICACVVLRVLRQQFCGGMC